MPKLFYSDRQSYKYEVEEDIAFAIPVCIPIIFDHRYMRFEGSTDVFFPSWLTIKRGYAWDGPSGPAIDTKTFMRGSLGHDGLYQLCRMRILDPVVIRPIADQCLHDWCREDGMWAIRAGWVKLAVKTFAQRAVRPKPFEEMDVVLEAP